MTLPLTAITNEKANQISAKADEDDSACLAWHMRLPDLKPCNFSLWGLIKNHVHVSPNIRNMTWLLHQLLQTLVYGRNFPFD